jgi:glycosyltransferase domain-containing protein
MLTILIITRNRPEFVDRLLKYYVDTSCDYAIAIADSSDQGNAEQVKAAVKKNEDRLRVSYQKYSGEFNFSASIQELNKTVHTPYIVQCPDDDFLVTEGLKKSVDFLNNNPGYGAAHGIGVVLTLKSDGPYGEIDKIGKYNQPVLLEATASERLIKHLSRYSVTLFSVHRTDIWRQMYKDVHLIKDESFRGELLPACLSVVYGKIQEIDSLYVVRQVHNRRHCYHELVKRSESCDWKTSRMIFTKSVAGELAKVDNIDPGMAEKTVNDAFSVYLSDVTCQKAAIKNRLKAVVKNIPLIGKTILTIRDKIRPAGKDYSLPALLDPKHRFYKDFIPVYNSITRNRNQ